MANAPSNLKAMRFCRETAERLATAPDCEDIRRKIVLLFVEERKTPLEISISLNGSLGVPHDIGIDTVASAVRRAVNMLIDKETLREIRSGFHADSIRRTQENVNRGRDEWMREHGMHVWESEENRQLLQLADGTRTHQEIADAMNLYFDSEEFTMERCKRRLRYLREGK